MRLDWKGGARLGQGALKSRNRLGIFVTAVLEVGWGLPSMQPGVEVVSIR